MNTKVVAIVAAVVLAVAGWFVSGFAQNGRDVKVVEYKTPGLVMDKPPYKYTFTNLTPTKVEVWHNN